MRITNVVSFLLGLAIPCFAELSVEELFNLPDNKMTVRTSLGVRGARPLGSRQVEMRIGFSVNPIAGNPLSYRIISRADERYAYEKFVTPVKASVQKEREVAAPEGCAFPAFEKTTVILELPFDMREGVGYFIVAQGVKDQMVTAGHTAASFVYEAGKIPPVPSDATDRAVLGLRRLESVGEGVIRLEFGPCFSSAAASKLDNYDIRVDGKPVKPLNFGRRTMVDMYLPVGWPFPAIAINDIFLRLPVPLEDGQRVEVRVAPSVTSAGNTASLDFNATSSLTYSIKVNQIGYIADGPVKIAYLGRLMGSFPEMQAATSASAGGVVMGPALAFASAPVFSIRDVATGKSVFTGASKLIHISGEKNEGVYNVDHSGENVYVLDFTAFKTPGAYFISIPGVGRSHVFQIGNDVYAKALAIQAHGLYAARCGIALGPPHTPWTRVACHTNGLLLSYKPRRDGEFIDPSFIIKRPATGEPVKIMASGGHHDAGDYNPRSHIDVAQTLMGIYEIAPRKFKDNQFNIPESGNGFPDVLDEAFWALRLWLGLQDADGGVRNGTESNGDPNFIETVELDPLLDIAYAKDAEGSYIFAGTFAQASRIWKSLGKTEEAADFLTRARKAYAWAEQNPDTLTAEQYGAHFLSAKAYAAAELLKTTGEPAFNRAFIETCVLAINPGAELDAWQKYDQNLAAFAYATCPRAAVDPALQDTVRNAIIKKADTYIHYSSSMAYGFIKNPWAPVTWGTGAQTHWLQPIIWAHSFTKDPKYLAWIIRTCDNTLGANPTGLAYITGAGTRTVRAPLHNSRYSTLGEVIDGFTVQGPHQAAPGYNVAETAHPKATTDFAPLHTYVDAHFAIAMNEGMVPQLAENLAAFSLLAPDQEE